MPGTVLSSIILSLSESVSHSVVSSSLQLWWPVATRLLCPWISPGKNTGVGCHSLLQGSNMYLLRCRHILYCLSLQGSINLTINMPGSFFFLIIFIYNENPKFRDIKELSHGHKVSMYHNRK